MALYPAFQRWIADSGVKVLAVWGGGDPIFGPAGAEALGRLGEKVRILDGGHFLLETHLDEVVGEIVEFLAE